jgi:hypothetical protein
MSNKNLSKEQMLRLNIIYYIIFVIGAGIAVGGMLFMRLLIEFIVVSSVGICICCFAFFKGRKLEEKMKNL